MLTAKQKRTITMVVRNYSWDNTPNGVAQAEAGAGQLEVYRQHPYCLHEADRREVIDYAAEKGASKRVLNYVLSGDD